MASGLNLDMNSKKCTLEKIIDIKLRKKFLQGVLLDDVGNFLSIQFQSILSFPMDGFHFRP